MLRDFLIAVSVILILGINDCDAMPDPTADMRVSNARVQGAWVATFANLSFCQSIAELLNTKQQDSKFECTARPQ